MIEMVIKRIPYDIETEVCKQIIKKSNNSLYLFILLLIIVIILFLIKYFLV